MDQVTEPPFTGLGDAESLGEPVDAFGEGEQDFESADVALEYNPDYEVFDDSFANEFQADPGDPEQMHDHEWPDDEAYLDDEHPEVIDETFERFSDEAQTFLETAADDETFADHEFGELETDAFLSEEEEDVFFDQLAWAVQEEDEAEYLFADEEEVAEEYELDDAAFETAEDDMEFEASDDLEFFVAEDHEYEIAADAYLDDDEALIDSDDEFETEVDGFEAESGTKIIIKHPHFPAKATINATKASALNRRLGKKYGWRKHRTRITGYLLKFLGWTSIASDEAFAIGIAKWQMIKGLRVTGVLGRRSWIQMKASLCMGYLPGEVRKSRTAAGYIQQDVTRFRGHLLISDFGVNRAHVKRRTRSEPLLRQWLRTFEQDTSYRLIVRGLSDCVGGGVNPKVRLARAKAVYKLLGPSARSRARYEAGVFTANKRLYIEPNHTPYGRARNRSVFIIFTRVIEGDPEDVTGEPPSDDEICRNAKRALQQHKKAGISIDKNKLKRLHCVLDKMKDQTTDDRVIFRDKWHAENYGPSFKKPLPPDDFEKLLVFRFRDYARKNLFPKDPDRSILISLKWFDEQVLRGVTRVDAIQSGGAHISQHSPGNQVEKWIRDKQKDKKSLYRCYRGQ